jgi:hypothetical protein
MKQVGLNWNEKDEAVEDEEIEPEDAPSAAVMSEAAGGKDEGESGDRQEMLMAAVNEDEEKLYDRVPTELQVMGCLSMGFPEQSYVEMKIDELQDRIMNVTRTRQGTVRIPCRDIE